MSRRLVTAPVIIIGAPRSGTNMLRDVLTQLPGAGTWHCDEINYIWRHGNTRVPTDELTPEMARDEVQRYIRGHFEKLAARKQLQFVVEKTCANSLRVPFVRRILPEAKYIFIRRSPFDAIASAKKRWTADLDLMYVMRKARFVPISDLPYYAAKYLWSRCHRLYSKEKRVASWGPRIQGLDAFLQSHTLDEVCALQWKRCVESAADAFAEMGSDRYVDVQYEQFVRDPERLLRGILDFIEMPADQASMNAAIADVSDRSIGRGRRTQDGETIARLQPIIDDALQRFGYE